jgi:hypothetical protein
MATFLGAPLSKAMDHLPTLDYASYGPNGIGGHHHRTLYRISSLNSRSSSTVNDDDDDRDERRLEEVGSDERRLEEVGSVSSGRLGREDSSDVDAMELTLPAKALGAGALGAGAGFMNASTASIESNASMASTLDGGNDTPYLQQQKGSRSSRRSSRSSVESAIALEGTDAQFVVEEEDDDEGGEGDEGGDKFDDMDSPLVKGPPKKHGLHSSLPTKLSLEINGRRRPSTGGDRDIDGDGEGPTFITSNDDVYVDSDGGSTSPTASSKTSDAGQGGHFRRRVQRRGHGEWAPSATVDPDPCTY